MRHKTQTLINSIVYKRKKMQLGLRNTIYSWLLYIYNQAKISKAAQPGETIQMAC